MIILGTIVNTAAVIAGGSIGTLLKKGIPERINSLIMNGLALCVIYIGISGAIKGDNALIAILSVSVGAVIGELANIDKGINKLGSWLETRFSRKGSEMSLAQGFVSGSMLFCIGVMTVVGSLESGLSGDHHTIYTKSLMDFIAAIVLASTLGAGVILSGLFVLVYQGALTLAASLLAPLLNTYTITNMTCVGSILIIGLGLNMLKLTDIKIANLLPAVFLPILLCLFM